MTAIAHRDMPGFVQLAILYVGVFAATTAVAVFYRFIEERFGLLWRSWLTRKVTDKYLDARVYYHLKEIAEIENPDQRIADDVRAFTTTTLSFTLIILNATLAAISFSGVLWAISPMLFGVAVGYAALGTLLTIYLGRPLVWLNYRQSDCEADFRANLIHVRENADSIAVSQLEAHLKQRLFRGIDRLVDNFRSIISVNRNLGFFTTAYNYLIQIIPTLIIAPSFIRGEIEFGVITQSAMAFAQLLGAFSLIVNQFGSISTFAAVTARLDAMAEAVDSARMEHSGIVIVEDAERIGCNQLTLRAKPDGPALIANLSISIPRGMRVLVTGPNEVARVALFRAVAGTWPTGYGQITRPPLDAIGFLPQRPYIPPGTLRDALLGTNAAQQFTDEQVEAALSKAGLKSVFDLAGGLDVEIDWSTKLSLGQQQLLAMTRIVLNQPKVALLDRASTALGKDQLQQVLQRLTEHSIPYIAFDELPATPALFDAVLEFDADGGLGGRQGLIHVGSAARPAVK